LAITYLSFWSIYTQIQLLYLRTSQKIYWTPWTGDRPVAKILVHTQIRISGALCPFLPAGVYHFMARHIDSFTS
jgi:hypothetical protein